MEPNKFPIVAKKFWNIVRLMYLVLRKEISKRKVLFDLNMTLNRAKLADKLASIQNLMFHHIHNLSKPDVPIKKYEVTKSSTSHPILLLFHPKKREKRHNATRPNDERPIPDEDVFMEASLEIFHSAAASPALSGFGPSPMVRQVRITDSPFPLRDVDVSEREKVSLVDDAAEDFIMKFYEKMRRQNLLGTPSPNR